MALSRVERGGDQGVNGGDRAVVWFPFSGARSAGTGTVREGGGWCGRRSGDGEVTVGREGPSCLRFFSRFFF